MKKIATSFLISISFFPFLYAQTGELSSTTQWADKPVIHSVDSRYNNESAVILSDNRTIAYTDESKENMVTYYTMHRIVHVNDDRGIEEFNKIYLDVNENADIIDIKARTILPGGKVIDFDKKNIKDIKEDDGNTYKIFALDGLEKGCEIEYYYKFKRPSAFFGTEWIQESSPVAQTTFSLICPDRLHFDFKPDNFSANFPDTVIDHQRIVKCSFSNTPGAEEEKYAAYRANLRRIEYKLSYNDSGTKGERMFTWNTLAKKIYTLYNFTTDKESKEISATISGNGWDKLADESAKIIAIENYVKKHFSYQEQLADDDANKLETVLRNKVAGTTGIMRLYSAIFQSLGISYQYVYTCDRTKSVIDKAFENWDDCDYPLMYFPNENKFVAPTRADFRYPWIVPEWGNTNGLFCKPTSLGNFTTAIAVIKPIPLEDYSKSFDDIESKITFDKNLDSVIVDSKQLFAGYMAMEYRGAFNFSDDDQKRLLIKNLGKIVSNSEHLVFSEILNQDFDDGVDNKPLILHTRSTSEGLTEQAGNKILLKIGLAIGPQEEMYQEKPRQEPVYVSFGHIEERKIDFVIPDGYTISNLNDLKIQQNHLDEGMGFTVDYEVKGNVLSIHIMEQYRNTSYPLSQFDDFRKVINASSDFNKVVLVLEKKG